MHKSLIFGVVVGLLFAVPAAAYDYPITNPFQATVVGVPVPELRAQIPEVKFRTGYLDKTVDREIPDALWYNWRIPYLFAMQRKPAPLVFVIAGTGASHDATNNRLLMGALYESGYHVVGLSSPSQAGFITAAGSTGVPGYLSIDAEDLYRVMQGVRDDFSRRNRDRITGYGLTGYSLGGIHSAFVAKLDKERGDFNFSKVLMINPPLSMYSSVSRLDRMIESVPGGIDNFPAFFQKLVAQVSAAYNESDTVAFDETLFFKAFQQNPPGPDELAGLIGAAFRISASNLIATSDIVTRFGFAIPANAKLNRSTSLTRFSQVTVRTGFTDYYHEMYFPFYQAKEPSLTRQALAERQTLISIQGFLRDADYIGVVHNRDDIILEPGQIDFFPEVLGDRAIIYPHGGHLGNLSYRDNIRDIQAFFTEGWK
ncbi:MAG: alpha/beta hydrolase [Gammaproteobacteria bacterium]